MGVAIALAFSVQSASAAEQFSALDGIQAAPMTASQMAAVRGAHIGIFSEFGKSGGLVGDPNLTQHCLIQLIQRPPDVCLPRAGCDPGLGH